jgi:lipoprotein-anchoring transpeptidase ErfK/SrfK
VQLVAGPLRVGVVALVAAATVVGVHEATAPAGAAHPAAQVAAPAAVARPTVGHPQAAARPYATSTVVVAAKGVEVFASPAGSHKMTLPGETPLGAVQTLLAVGSRPGWWHVALPTRPNGNTGWVQRGDVQASTITTLIEVDRAAHRLTLLRNGVVAARYPVGVGTSTTPTPAGLFYVTDNLSTGSPGGAYGPYALGLSGHSDVLLQFGSGDGVLGIHGTNEPGSIGHDATHGCIRLRNPDIVALRAKVPLGAPVQVV